MVMFFISSANGYDLIGGNDCFVMASNTEIAVYLQHSLV